jgi:flagellar hook-associated protein 2
MTFIGSLSGSPTGSSGSASSAFSNSITGLASGVNTDSIVQGLMQAAQVPLVQQMQQRQILQWQELQYQQVESSLTSLQTNLQTMQLQSTFLAQTTSSTNSSLVSATVGGHASNGSYNVTVSQLAQGATITSSSTIGIDPTTLQLNPNYGNETLATLTGDSNPPAQISITVNGTQLQFDPSKDTINSVLSAISSNPSTGVTGYYDSSSGKVVLQTTATGSGAQIHIGDATENGQKLFQDIFKLTPPSSLNLISGSFTADSDKLPTGGEVEINGTKFDFSANTLLTDVVTKINGATGQTGVTANYSGGQLTLSGTDLFSPISVTDPNDVTDKSTILNMPNPPSQPNDIAAADAYYSVNGVNLTSASNNPTYNGVNFSLQGTTPANSSVAVTVSSDTTAIVKTITNFVQQYNQTLQMMQGFYNQKRYYDYQPLTSDQASQMTQTQIDEWNQKAENGLLSNDTLLDGAMNGMNDAANAIATSLPSINGQAVTTTSLASIGISPIDPLNGLSSGATAPGVTTTGWNSYGLLQIDTQALTNAVQANPQAVMELFTNGSGSTSTNTSGQGIAVQLLNSVSNSIKQFTSEAGVSSTLSATSTTGSTETTPLPYTLIDPNADFTSLFATDGYDVSFLGQQISQIDSSATDMQTQLTQLKQRYQNEFSQMEQSISQINSQSSSFISMMGSGSSSSSGG